MNFVSVPLRIHAHTRCHKMLITYIYESSRPIRVCRSTQVVIFDWKTISSVNKYIVGAFGVSHLKLRGIRIMCAPIYARVFFLFVFCANPVCQRLSHSEMGTGQKNVLFIQWMCRRLSSFFFLLSCGISVIDGVVGVTFRWLLIISRRRFFLFVRAQVFRCYYLLYVACGRVAKQLIFDPISAQQVEMCADLMTTMTPKTNNKNNKQNEKRRKKTAHQPCPMTMMKHLSLFVRQRRQLNNRTHTLTQPTTVWCVRKQRKKACTLENGLAAENQRRRNDK